MARPPADALFFNARQVPLHWSSQMMTKLDKRLLLLGALAFSFFVVRPAGAVRVDNNLSRPATGSAIQAPSRNGIVNSIDLKLNTIVIDGVTYRYSPAAVVARSSDSSSMRNPLDLAKGDRIQFLTQKEPGSRLERVIEIRLPQGNDSYKKAK